MADITITLEEGDRQLTLLALAICALNRPGFDYALSEIAAKLEPGWTPEVESMYTAFKRLNADTKGDVNFVPKSEGIAVNMQFDRPTLKRFKKMYAEAVQANEEKFTFNGGVYLVRYAKYLIEHLESQL